MSVRNLRIHLLGASGSGATTLGRALAKQFRIPSLDADDIYWERTNPPFTTKRSQADRDRLLHEQTRSDSWVVSGALTSWGLFLRTEFTHVIFLHLPAEIRLNRILQRERERYGDRILPGRDMHAIHQEFIQWTKRYETGGMDVRSRVYHEAWMRSLPCPVLRLETTEPTAALVEKVKAFVARRIEIAQITRVPGDEANSFYENFGRGRPAQASDLSFLALSSAREIFGTVRFCVEEGQATLRGMLIAETARKQGIGQALLKEFQRYLEEAKPGALFCIAHGHLERFYGLIGFAKVADADAPAFLQTRLKKYRGENMPDAILMRRP